MNANNIAANLPGRCCVPKLGRYLFVNARIHAGNLIAFHFVPERSSAFRREPACHEQNFGCVKVLCCDWVFVSASAVCKEHQTHRAIGKHIHN